MEPEIIGRRRPGDDRAYGHAATGRRARGREPIVSSGSVTNQGKLLLRRGGGGIRVPLEPDDLQVQYLSTIMPKISRVNLTNILFILSYV